MEDGYDALHALRNLFTPDSDKGKTIAFLEQEFKKKENGSIIHF